MFLVNVGGNMDIFNNQELVVQLLKLACMAAITVVMIILACWKFHHHKDVPLPVLKKDESVKSFERWLEKRHDKALNH